MGLGVGLVDYGPAVGRTCGKRATLAQWPGEYGSVECNGMGDGRPAGYWATVAEKLVLCGVRTMAFRGI